MALSLLFNRQVEESIAGIVLDATVRQRHSFASSVTNFQVELGANISDNISKDPIQLQIDGMISDNPIKLFSLGSDFIDSISGQASRSRSAAEELIRIDREKQIFTVVTGLRVYENMTFSNLDFNYDENTGKAINFIATLTEIRFVESQIIGIERDKLFDEFQEQASIIDNGKQVTEDIISEETQSSILARLVDLGFNKFLPGI